MTNIKPSNLKKLELVGLYAVILFIVINALVSKDSPIAVVSAICGITYTMLAGLGNPSCYLFGITGSCFYGYLAFDNALWGNLLLYVGYYVPMQALGFFKWRQNLKKESKEIVKISLPLKERLEIFFVTISVTIVTIVILYFLNDKSPIIDGITTIFSIAGMYLTVKRAIEQWLAWFVVNGLSLIMWLKIALTGERVYSTVIMWFVYFLLSIYFYVKWRKEIKTEKLLVD